MLTQKFIYVDPSVFIVSLWDTVSSFSALWFKLP